MPCFHPMPAVRLSDGSVTFTSRSKVDGNDFELPCGQCVGCRLERSRQWAVRCVHESQMHERNCFITLTYSDEFLPPHRGLVYRDFQLFMKRLRKRIGFPVRFFMCGEYGELDQRPHFHAILFGCDFDDRKYFSKTGSGYKLYTSDLLSELWGMGHCPVGNVTFDSAAYVARYCMKKVTGDLADAHYAVDTVHGVFQRMPEFAHMSLKPGIGSTWLAKYRSDVFPRDYVVINGVKTKPPKYYDRLNDKENADVFLGLKDDREYAAYLVKLEGEFSVERVAAKEAVKLAQISQLRRS